MELYTPKSTDEICCAIVEIEFDDHRVHCTGSGDCKI